MVFGEIVQKRLSHTARVHFWWVEVVDEQLIKEIVHDRFGCRYKFSAGMSDAWVAFVD